MSLTSFRNSSSRDRCPTAIIWGDRMDSREVDRFSALGPRFASKRE